MFSLTFVTVVYNWLFYPPEEICTSQILQFAVQPRRIRQGGWIVATRCYGNRLVFSSLHRPLRKR
jgi:hypothetical protein